MDKKSIVIFIVCILILGGIIYFGSGNKNEATGNTKEVASEVVNKVGNTGQSVSGGCQNYRNEKLSYEINCPKNWDSTTISNPSPVVTDFLSSQQLIPNSDLPESHYESAPTVTIEVWKKDSNHAKDFLNNVKLPGEVPKENETRERTTLPGANGYPATKITYKTKDLSGLVDGPGGPRYITEYVVMGDFMYSIHSESINSKDNDKFLETILPTFRILK